MLELLGEATERFREHASVLMDNRAPHVWCYTKVQYTLVIQEYKLSYGRRSYG